MSQAGPATTCASRSVSKKRGLWKRAANDVSSMIANSDHRKSVQSAVSLDGEAKQDLDVSELLVEFSKFVRLETRPAVTYLQHLVDSFKGMTTIKCSLNRVLLKALVELEFDKKSTAHLNFRATNALHLSGSGLQARNAVSFEVSLVDDGIMFTNIEGFSVSVTVLKGTFRCDVLQARIQCVDGQLLLRLETRNPLIGSTSDDLLPVDLQANLNHIESVDDDDEHKRDQQLERKQNARHLRNTASGMRAFDVTVNRIAHTALGLGIPAEPERPRSRFECIKTLITIYAFSLVLVASYFYLMTKVPQIVPIAMTLSAISFFILGCERQWTYKTDLAVLLNTFSMIVITVCLYQIF